MTNKPAVRRTRRTSLTKQQREFLCLYKTYEGNYKKAAEQAGYSDSYALKLRNDKKIKALMVAIDKELELAQMEANGVFAGFKDAALINLLCYAATADMADYMQDVPDGNGITHVKPLSKLTLSQRRNITKITVTSIKCAAHNVPVTTYELIDKEDARSQLVKLIGLDKVSSKLFRNTDDMDVDYLIQLRLQAEREVDQSRFLSELGVKAIPALTE